MSIMLVRGMLVIGLMFVGTAAYAEPGYGDPDSGYTTPTDDTTPTDEGQEAVVVKMQTLRSTAQRTRVEIDNILRQLQSPSPGPHWYMPPNLGLEAYNRAIRYLQSARDTCLSAEAAIDDGLIAWNELMLCYPYDRACRDPLQSRIDDAQIIACSLLSDADRELLSAIRQWDRCTPPAGISKPGIMMRISSTQLRVQTGMDDAYCGP